MDSHLQGAHSTLTSRIPNRSWRVPLSNLEDHPAFTYHTTVFDPDHAISGTLLTRLASATASTTSQLCQPFVKSGTILDTTNNDSSIALNSILLDSGAQGSNFLARQVYDQLPSDVKHLSCPTNRVVRLGDSRSLAINLEVPLTLAIPDSQGLHHQYLLWYSILEILSHDVIIMTEVLIMTCSKILSFPAESLPPPSLSEMKSIPSHLRSTPLQALRILI